MFVDKKATLYATFRSLFSTGFYSVGLGVGLERINIITLLEVYVARKAVQRLHDPSQS